MRSESTSRPSAATRTRARFHSSRRAMATPLARGSPVAILLARCSLMAMLFARSRSRQIHSCALHGAAHVLFGVLLFGFFERRVVELRSELECALEVVARVP